MPLIRTRQDIEDKLGGPTPAEEKLLAACLEGDGCDLSSKVPEENAPTPDVHIRADVLRYLITGGCDAHPVAYGGVRLHGAYITGFLRLSYASAHGTTTLTGCRFSERIAAAHAKFGVLNLRGSFLRHGIFAEGAQIRGHLLLSDIRSEGEVRLQSASIGGYFDCERAIFGTAFEHERNALNMQSARVEHSVVLRQITATANVSMSGTRIGGQLDCTGAKFRAESGSALNAQYISVTEGLYFELVEIPNGYLSLASAQVGDLVDDQNSWPGTERLYMHGFNYARINNRSFPDVDTRLTWLAKGSLWLGVFYPQPYTQLAKVYREMGHDADARRVLRTREKLVRFHERKNLPPVVRSWHWVWDKLQYVVVGHGHAPFWSIGWLALLIFLTIVPAHYAWEEGSFAPNSGPVIVSDGWTQYTNTEPAPAQVWSGDVPPAGWQPPDATTRWKDIAEGRDWETFNCYAYAADVVIPIIDFGQTQAWAPSTTRGPWGEVLWWWRWVATVLGWIVTALGAAAITGIIRRE